MPARQQATIEIGLDECYSCKVWNDDWGCLLWRGLHSLTYKEKCPYHDPKDKP